MGKFSIDQLISLLWIDPGAQQSCWFFQGHNIRAWMGLCHLLVEFLAQSAHAKYCIHEQRWFRFLINKIIHETINPFILFIETKKPKCLYIEEKHMKISNFNFNCMYSLTSRGRRWRLYHRLFFNASMQPFWEYNFFKQKYMDCLKNMRKLQ